MLKCSECGHKLFEETKYMSWLSLINLAEHLWMEGIIELETKEYMQDKLMDFKGYALDESGIPD